jgi:asparagine synthase (glutamine-hydrolysing)
MGFGVPLHDWLRGPLRAWAESRLERNHIARHDLFDTSEVRHIWEEHLRGYSNNAATLWPILMFDAWADETRHVDGSSEIHTPSVAEQLGSGTELPGH